MQALIQAGADPNAKDNEGNTPLHRAADKGNLEVAKALMQAGADPNAKENDGWTVLHSAAGKQSEPESESKEND